MPHFSFNEGHFSESPPLCRMCISGQNCFEAPQAPSHLHAVTYAGPSYHNSLPLWPAL